MRRSDLGCGDSGAERTGVGRRDDRRERDSATVGSGLARSSTSGDGGCLPRARCGALGGLAAVSKITGLARSTINRGKDDLDAAALPKGRVRRAGGGRRALSKNDPGLVRAPERLVTPATLGDPMRPLIWVSKSVEKLAATLTEIGHPDQRRHGAQGAGGGSCSRRQSNRQRTRRKHPDRNAPFESIDSESRGRGRRTSPKIPTQGSDGGAPGATGRRALRNASGQISPSRTKSRPSRTKKMGLDFLGFLRPIRGFSRGCEQSKSKKNCQAGVLVGARRPARMLRGPLAEATGASGRSPWVTRGSSQGRLGSFGRAAFKPIQIRSPQKPPQPSRPVDRAVPA